MAALLVRDGRAAYEDFGRKDTVLQHTAEGGGLWRHWVPDGRAAYEDLGRKDTVLQHTAEGGGLWRHWVGDGRAVAALGTRWQGCI